jgi:hypothetical protein
VVQKPSLAHVRFGRHGVERQAGNTLAHDDAAGMEARSAARIDSRVPLTDERG